MTLVNTQGESLKDASKLAIPGASNGPDVQEELKHMETLDVSKITPLETQIVIKIASEVTLKTAGGLWLPAASVQMDMMNKCSAEFVKAGNEAFLNANGDYISNKPEEGDTVIFAKHAGAVFKDTENNIYRFCEDRDVKAIIRKEVE